MLQEVFELIMQIHTGMHIVAVGLSDGTTIERKHETKGSSDTEITITLEKTDVGFASFKRHKRNSYINNQGMVTSETNFTSFITVPYSNITYVEFSEDDE